MYKEVVALNDVEWLIYHKTKSNPNKTYKPLNYVLKNEVRLV